MPNLKFPIANKLINKHSVYYTNVLSGKCPPLSVKLHTKIHATNIIDFAIKSVRKIPSPSLSMELSLRAILLPLYIALIIPTVSSNDWNT